MKQLSRKTKNAVAKTEAYDLHLMQAIEAQLALAREISELTKELNACLAHLNKALGVPSKKQVIPYPERPN